MIYTYGDVKEYDSALAEKKRNGEHLLKLGQTDYSSITGYPYSGGVVWETIEEVQAHIETLYCDGYGVYELSGKWENVYLKDDERNHRLLEDRIVIKRVN